MLAKLLLPEVEGTISLSKVLKATPQINKNHQKVIGIKSFYTQQKEVREERPVDPHQSAGEIVERAKFEAEQTIRAAQNQREKMEAELQLAMNNWEMEKERLRQQVKKEAYHDGFNQGVQKGYEEVQTLIEKTNEIVSKAELDYHHHLRNSERTIVEMAVQIAEKIIGEKLKEDEAYVSMTKQALEQVKENKTAYVYVHPDHYEFLLRTKQELQYILPAEAELYIYANPELSVTSCYIKTPGGKLDASVEVQLSQIKEKLLEWLEEDKA